MYASLEVGCTSIHSLPVRTIPATGESSGAIAAAGHSGTDRGEPQGKSACTPACTSLACTVYTAPTREPRSDQKGVAAHGRTRVHARWQALGADSGLCQKTCRTARTDSTTHLVSVHNSDTRVLIFLLLATSPVLLLLRHGDPAQLWSSDCQQPTECVQ